MTFAGEILVQTLRDLWQHKLRSTFTMFGISWGIASIVFMIAIGDGFKLGYRKMLSSLGTDIIILWGGRTAARPEDNAWARRALLLRRCPRDPGGMLTGPACDRGAGVRAAGPEPVQLGRLLHPRHHADLPGDPLHEAGRWAAYLGTGCPDARAVCVIGEDVQGQLFAGHEAVGAQIYIGDVAFTVIGTLAKKEQNNSYSGLDGTKVLIPYTTMARHFPTHALSSAPATSTTCCSCRSPRTITRRP